MCFRVRENTVPRTVWETRNNDFDDGFRVFWSMYHNRSSPSCIHLYLFVKGSVLLFSRHCETISEKSFRILCHSVICKINGQIPSTRLQDKWHDPVYPSGPHKFFLQVDIKTHSFTWTRPNGFCLREIQVTILATLSKQSGPLHVHLFSGPTILNGPSLDVRALLFVWHRAPCW